MSLRVCGLVLEKQMTQDLTKMAPDLTKMAQDQTTRTSSELQYGTTAADNPISPPGYELREEIGHGGMGVVYRARDIALDRDVAVKLLSQRFLPESLPAQRFLG